MMNKSAVSLLFISTILLSACSPKPNLPLINNSSNNSTSVGQCTPQTVTIAGYGDRGHRLNNCFVEYPGEPSRQDKSYYIVEDICGQFTQQFVQNALSKPIVSVEASKNSGLYNCTYFLNSDKKDYVMLVLDYLKIENQKIGQEAMGRRTEVSTQIPMRNMVVWQSDGLLNSIYLVLGDEKFISIQRSSGSVLMTDTLITFAGNLAKEIKNYK
jgi:hypothetical protein